MRKSFYTFSGLVRAKMGKDLLDGSVYVFIIVRRDRIKLLHMEPGGLVLYTKVLERGELHVPQRLFGPGTKAIEWRELVVRIEGMIVEDRHCSHQQAVHHEYDTDIAGLSIEERKEKRQKEAYPVIKDLETWLYTKVRIYPEKSPMARR